jgi:hypothetical protein
MNSSMNRLLLAALLAGAIAGASAQQPAAPDVPRHKCEPRPQMPMAALMNDNATRKKLQREIEQYKACMKAYADERAAAARAHTEAGNAAINEYNETMKALQDSQR